MPRNVVQQLLVGQIRTAEDFVAFLQVFPASLASELGWNARDMQNAKRILLETLRPHLHPEFFADEPSFTPPLGVVPRSRAR